MREEVKKRNWTSVKVHSADGFQANEADLVYILTTRSTPVADSLLRLIREKVLDFIRDERRATVALSRAREGVILHGNLKTMCTGEAWRGFVLEALRGTKIVSPDAYLAALESGTDPETLTLPPWTLGVTESGFTRGHPPSHLHPQLHLLQGANHTNPNARAIPYPTFYLLRGANPPFPQLQAHSLFQRTPKGSWTNSQIGEQRLDFWKSLIMDILLWGNFN